MPTEYKPGMVIMGLAGEKTIIGEIKEITDDGRLVVYGKGRDGRDRCIGKYKVGIDIKIQLFKENMESEKWEKPD